jgi:predicted HAD superfamily phosphohydrolase YqeG
MSKAARPIGTQLLLDEAGGARKGMSGVIVATMIKSMSPAATPAAAIARRAASNAMSEVVS